MRILVVEENHRLNQSLASSLVLETDSLPNFVFVNIEEGHQGRPHDLRCGEIIGASFISENGCVAKTRRGTQRTGRPRSSAVLRWLLRTDLASPTRTPASCVQPVSGENLLALSDEQLLALGLPNRTIISQHPNRWSYLKHNCGGEHPINLPMNTTNPKSTDASVTPSAWGDSCGTSPNTRKSWGNAEYNYLNIYNSSGNLLAGSGYPATGGYPDQSGNFTVTWYRGS